MPQGTNEITLGENVLRIEDLRLPNGNTYTLGCSFAEAQEIYNTLTENIEAVNDDVEDLSAVVEDNEQITSVALNALNQKIDTKGQDLEDLKATVDENDLVTSNALNTLNEKIDDNVEQLSGDLQTLSETVDDNAFVTSTALNDLNQKIDDSVETLNTAIEENELVVSSLLNDLNQRLDDEVSEINSDIDSLVSKVRNNELVTSAALNELNQETTNLENEFTKVTYQVTNITYSELKDLRDNSQLKPGQVYRITDFVTTTTQSNTRSAGHRFDLLVLATDTDTLLEDAKAIRHEGDTYFTDANLSMWELKYTLDNDDDVYGWADTTNGKGVIYWMKDEWDNECPYDFKNIQFKRYKITACPKSPSLVGQYSQRMPDITVDTSVPYWCYTFSMINLFEDVTDDVTVFQEKYPFDSFGSRRLTANNIIKEYIDFKLGTILKRYLLSENVFVTDTSLCNISENYHSGRFLAFKNNTVGIDCYSNTFGNGCTFNTFGSSCLYNTFGSSCQYNTFGNSCQYNTFGNSCQYNTFGNDCDSNTFGDSCAHNTFGDSCAHNTFGNHCNYSIFGNYCNYSIFGSDCYYNTFGGNCTRNTFGDSCTRNTFGNDCTSNTIGNYCNYNTFGNGCYSNTFGSDCNSNAFGIDCDYNAFGSDCDYNAFGNGCYSNTFGSDCDYNAFGNSVVRRTLTDGDDNFIIENTDKIFQTKNDILYPVSHPDLSTQPSILPQRFGNMEIKEVLIPIIEAPTFVNPERVLPVEMLPSNVMVIEASWFCEYCKLPAIMVFNDISQQWSISTNPDNIPSFTEKTTHWYALVRYTNRTNIDPYYY